MVTNSRSSADEAEANFGDGTASGEMLQPLVLGVSDDHQDEGTLHVGDSRKYDSEVEEDIGDMVKVTNESALQGDSSEEDLGVRTLEMSPPGQMCNRG